MLSGNVGCLYFCGMALLLSNGIRTVPLCSPLPVASGEMPSRTLMEEAKVRAEPAAPGLAQLPGGASGNAKMVLGTFQAIVAPFDPGMLGQIAGGVAPQLPSLPGNGATGRRK